MAAIEGVPKMNIEGIGRHGPPLLFCDTFNHEENEEMHLDLVSFPRPVCIREVRVIGRGTRPHVAIDRPGLTHPPTFKLEVFIRNLNKMQSVTFDKLGVLDYCEGISFQLNTKSEAATDVVVLRGWYTRLTVCLYGNLTTIQEVPLKIPEQPPVITPEIPAIEKPATEETLKAKEVQSSPVKVETTIDEKLKKDIDPKSSQTTPDPTTTTTSTTETAVVTNEENETSEKLIEKAIPSEEKVDEKAEDDAQRQSPDATDDLFEPLTPDKSPTDLFLSDEGDDLDQDGYEAILSDEEIMDDEHPYDDTDVLDFQLFAEDTWMSVSVSFNPYQCDLSKLMSFPSESSVEEPDDEVIEKFRTLLANYNKENRTEKSVNLQESIASSTLISMIAKSENQKELLSCLCDMAINALDIEEASTYPIAANIRRLKIGMKLAAGLCESSEDGTELLMQENIQEKLFNLLTTEHMSSSVKLVALQALHSSVEFPIGMERFISSKTQAPGEEDNLTGYKRLIDLLLADQTVRVVTAARSLFYRVHFYELMGSLQNVVEKIIENTNTLLAARSEPEQNNDVDTSIDIEGVDLKAVLNAQQLEIIIGCLEEVHNVLLHANQLLVQPHVQSFPTSVKITTDNDDVIKDPYPMLYRMLSHRKLLESILVLFSCPVGFLPPVFTAIRDIFFYLLQSQEGLLFLLSDPESINEIVRLLTQTETDFHYSEAPSLQDFLRDSSVADHCTPQHLGLLLIYHLQTLQAVDQLKLSHNSNSNGVDLDGADVLSTLHSLYSMTFTALGKSAVSNVLSMSTNLECLLPFVEGNEKTVGDTTKVKKSVSSRYASVLLLLTIQGSENVEILDRFGDRMWEIGQKDKESSLGQLSHWLSPVREVNFEVGSIPTLVEYVKSKVDELNNLNTACGILTTVRVIRYLAVPQIRRQDGDQKDLSLNLACIQLFSANAMDVFIKLTQKINEFLQRPWRLGQPFTSGHCYYVVSIVLPLLALVNQLLTELLSTSVYQFKDTRLLTELMVLYSIMSSVSGSLSSIAHKIQNEIVDVLMAFTRPVLQTTDTEEAINNSVWLLMLKELLHFTMSRPQFFLGGLSLLSELLPIPLPINTLEDLPKDEIEKLVKHRLLWSAHLNPLTSTIQSMLKDLSGSCCHSLQLILRRVCCQLADISASMALTVVRTLLEVINSDLPKKSVEKQENEEGKSPVDSDKMLCSPHVMRVITLIAYLSSQPAVKSALLFFLKPGNPDEVPFPDLLNSLLHILQMTSDEMAISRLKYCVVTIIQSLCDPQISLTLFDNPFSLNQLGDAMPDRTMFSSICSALLENIGSSSQSYATILQVLRTIVMLTEHDYGMFHIKLALKKDKEVFYRLFQRLCSSFKPGIPGPDSLSTLSTVTELLQLLLPPKKQSPSQTTDEPENTMKNEENQSDDTQSKVDVEKQEKDGEKMELDNNEKNEKALPSFQNADQVYLRKIHLSVLDLRELMKTGDEVEHPVETLETLLEKSCKEDETLEALLNGVISLKKVQEITGSESKQDIDVEPVLPATQALQTLFNKRAAFSAGEDINGRVSPTLWYSTPPPDDIDVENELISCDLEEVNDKYFSDFDLKAELEKGLLSTIEDSPKRKRGLRGLGKRKFASLILEKGDKRSKQEVVCERGRGRGIFRGGRGGPRYDNFRARKQNTSRPPSMHVDDFMAMEGGRGRGRAGQGDPNDRSSPGSSSIRKIQPLSRNIGDQRLDPGFLDGTGRWPLSNTSSRREVSLTPHAMPQLRNQPSWEPHQSTLDGGFLEQRGFQRNNWGTPASVNYRGFRETTYREAPVRGGYWAGPQQDTSRKEQSFLPPPPANFDNYRTGGNRGRHMRSFTR